MKLDPTEIYEKLVILGTDWAEKKYAAELLEDTRKPALARLKSESNATTQSAREDHAYAHEDYRILCKSITEAVKLETLAKVKYDSAKTYSDLMRTVAANERATLREAP